MKKDEVLKEINKMQEIMRSPVYDPILTTIMFYKHSGWEDEEKLKKVIKDKYKVLEGSFGKSPRTHFIKRNKIRKTIISMFKKWKECNNFKQSDLVYIFTQKENKEPIDDLVSKIYKDNPNNVITIIEEK